MLEGTGTTPGPFSEYNRKRPVAERIRPYNFLLVAHVAPFGHPPGADPERFLLVAPYESDPRKWRQLEWTNAYDAGSIYRIITEPEAKGRSIDGTAPVILPGEVIVKTYRDVLDDYRTHPEAKSLGPGGKPCDRVTVGLLYRRPVNPASLHYIGKESNKIEEALTGLVTDLDDVLTEYRDPEQVAEIAARTDVSSRTITRVRTNSPSARPPAPSSPPTRSGTPASSSALSGSGHPPTMRRCSPHTSTFRAVRHPSPSYARAAAGYR